MKTAKHKMKPGAWLPVMAGIGWLALGFCVHAQNYTLDWWSVDGGGGTSAGGGYSVSGTIGQPDAGAMSGGGFSLTGGFWSIITVLQTPGAPLLAIVQSGSNVMISWPSSSAGWTLQQCADLTACSWAACGLDVSDDGTNKCVTVSSPTGNLFFRLSQP